MGPYDFNGRPSQSLVDIRRLCGVQIQICRTWYRILRCHFCFHPSLTFSGWMAGTEYRMRSPRIWEYGWLVFSSFRCYQCMVMAAGALVTKKHPRLFTAALYVYILGRYLLEAYFALFEHSSNQISDYVAGWPQDTPCLTTAPRCPTVKQHPTRRRP